MNLERKQSVLNQAQGIAPLFYAIMVAIGMLFEYYRYIAFGINIFQYADIFDFLIAPFKDFLIIGFVLITTGIAYLAVLIDKFLRRFPKFYKIVNFGLTKKYWFKRYTQISFILVFGTYLVISSILFSEKNHKKIIAQNQTIEIMYADNELVKGNLIGKTKEVIFLYVDKKVTIIPSSSLIKKIEFLK